MARLPDKSIVTFRHDGVVVGVGFLVGKQRVLTCAHVVNAALGLDQRNQDQPTKALYVEFTRIKPDLERKANVVQWIPPLTAGATPNGKFDVAGLELTEEAPRAAKPLRFATPRPHSQVDVFGYPTQPAARPDGGWVLGHLLRPVDSGLLQIDSDQDGALRAQPGYSGSPVINEAGRVVGMLATASILPSQHDCYAIPPAWLRGAWPEAVPPVPENPDPGPRRRLPTSLWRWGSAAIAFLLVLMLVWIFIPASASGPNQADCVPLEVSVSTEKDELLAELAESYNTSGRTFGNGTCALINTTGFTSGTAMDALANGWPAEVVEGRPSPQVWLPSTSMWVDLLRHNGRGSLITPGAPKRVTTSVLVIAMPERMARAVQAERDNPGWQDILDLAINDEGWAEVGHPEWGQFVLGRDNPNFSSSGLAASVATYFAAAGKQNGLMVEDLANAEVTRYVRGIDSSVLRYGNEATEFMRSLYDEDRRGDADTPFVSAVLIQEQLVYLYNQGAPLGDLSTPGPTPKERMLAVHPREGTVEFDHPYLTLASASVEQRAAAQDFYKFLTEGAQQQRFIDSGFRALSDPTRPTTQLSETVGGSPRDRQRLVDLPEPAMLSAIQDAWDGTRKLARVLLVLDVSGSMNDPANDKVATLGSKLEVLKPAAKRGLSLLGNRDQVGIWTFNDTYREILPISDVGTVRPQLDGIIDSLVASGNTALHTTTLAAKDTLTRHIQDDRINAIVLLSDGRNHPEDPAGRARLLEQVAAENQESSVRIFTIPYGADPDPDQRPDFELLDQIAERSKARYYDEAIDPTNIDEVMVSVFSNFGG